MSSQSKSLKRSNNHEFFLHKELDDIRTRSLLPVLLRTQQSKFKNMYAQ
jgi:hypothetical protein